jgi:hypothetical protein
MTFPDFRDVVTPHILRCTCVAYTKKGPLSINPVPLANGMSQKQRLY